MEKLPGQGGEEDDINIGMEVLGEPDQLNQKPMATYMWRRRWTLTTPGRKFDNVCRLPHVQPEADTKSE